MSKRKYEQRVYEEFISVTPTFSSFYSRPMQDYGSNKRMILKPIVKRKDNRSIKRLQLALNYIILTSPTQYTYCKELKKQVRFRLNFITLTLSGEQKHDDSFIKSNLLDRFLKWIVYKGATGYVWKAEAQKNGRIHFHITCNKYIHWRDIRSYWNALQQRYGYLDSYFDNTGSVDANSTDVHAIKNESGAMKYMSKYLMKNQTDRREIERHKFGYSRNLANIRLIVSTHDFKFDGIYNYLCTLKPFTKKFDYVAVMYHNLINLKQCPQVLREMIMNAVSKKTRVKPTS